MTSSTQSLYDKALRSYLLTKYTQAANTCNKAIVALNDFHSSDEADQTLKLNIWTLYINIASTLLAGNNKQLPVKLLGIEDNARSLQDLCRGIWNKLNRANGPYVDARLTSACLILDCNLNQYNVGREIAEDWFAFIPDSVLDSLAQSEKQEGGYFEVVQLYTCRILPGMNDFDSASTFLQYNEILSESKKKQLNHIIQDQKDELEKEIIAQTKREEAAKLAAAARKKRAEEEEAKRIEKERQDELGRINLLEKQKQQKIAAAAELKKLVEVREETVIATPAAPASTTLKSRSTSTTTRANDNVTAIKGWISQMTAQGAASYATILIVVFSLLALLRGQRGRLTVALQTLLNKLWQTIKMGTKVTYM